MNGRKLQYIRNFGYAVFFFSEHSFGGAYSSFVVIFHRAAPETFAKQLFKYGFAHGKPVAQIFKLKGLVNV